MLLIVYTGMTSVSKRARMPTMTMVQLFENWLLGTVKLYHNSNFLKAVVPLKTTCLT